VKRLYFRGDAAFANPVMYEFLEADGIGYTIRLPANRVLQDRIGYLLKRPVGRPSHEVRRYYASFSYRAQSRNKPRRVVAKVEWHPGELYPRVGFIVTNLARPAERVDAFYNQRRSNGSKRVRARSNGPGCHAVPSPPIPSASSFTSSPTISAIDLATRSMLEGANRVGRDLSIFGQERQLPDPFLMYHRTLRNARSVKLVRASICSLASEVRFTVEPGRYRLACPAVCDPRSGGIDPQATAP
jgi:hypothetical protein